MGKFGSTYVAVQEHSIAEKMQKAAGGVCNQAGWATSLGPVDPELPTQTGGVGLMVREPNQCYTPKAAAEDYAGALKTGRAAKYLLDMGGHRTVRVMIIYGWANGDSSSAQAARTSDLLQAVRTEMRSWPAAPWIIAGGLNGPTDNIKAAHELLQDRGWNWS